MDPENEAPTVAVVSVDGEEPVLLTEELVEEIAVGSDAVEIARIEADAEITIAAINADTAVALEENNKEIIVARIENENERENEWQSEMMALRGNIAELETKLSDLATLLTPTPQPEPDLVIVEEMDPATLTPEYMSDQTHETPTEPTLKDVVERPAEEILAVAKRVKRRLI